MRGGEGGEGSHQIRCDKIVDKITMRGLMRCGLPPPSLLAFAASLPAPRWPPPLPPEPQCIF